MLRRVLLATGESIVGGAEPTMDFLRAAVVAIGAKEGEGEPRASRMAAGARGDGGGLLER